MADTKKTGRTQSSVDDFVLRRVEPEFRPIVAALRALMRECAPKAVEAICYGIPAWKGRRILALISPTKRDVTFAFSRGASFDDPWKLLRGVGHVSKHVKLRSITDIQRVALRSYITQALALDQQKAPAKRAPV